MKDNRMDQAIRILNYHIKQKYNLLEILLETGNTSTKQQLKNKMKILKQAPPKIIITCLEKMIEYETQA